MDPFGFRRSEENTLKLIIPNKLEEETTLRILGPSNARVWTSIAGVRALKIAIFEGHDS